MKDMFAIFMFSLIIISALGFNAFLIYKNVDGWGWFLFVSLLIVGSIKISVK